MVKNKFKAKIKHNLYYLHIRRYNKNKSKAEKRFNMTEELIKTLVCPHNPEFKCVTDDLIDRDSDGEFWVYCLCCCASGPVADTKQKARDYWNMRAMDMAYEWTCRETTNNRYGGPY